MQPVGQFKINNKNFVPSAFRRILDINSYAFGVGLLGKPRCRSVRMCSQEYITLLRLAECVHKSNCIVPLAGRRGLDTLLFSFSRMLYVIGESPSSQEITPANRGASRSATQLV